MKYLISIILSLLALIVVLSSLAIPPNKNIRFAQVPYEFLTTTEKKEVDCLTDNIYHEAGYEPRDGQIAVAQVTLNRVKSNLFEPTICGVVHQKKKTFGKVVCQFTWLCESPKKIRANSVYEEVRDVALYVYFNHTVMDDLTKGAIYYHADYVSPGWHKLRQTTKIGRHIFYSDPKVITRYDGKT